MTAVIIEADGGSRGNPGPAGYGAVVRDATTGEVLAERAEGLGQTTNNVAEYQGLVAGLRTAVELGASEADVRMDSKLVVEQMCGRWRVKNADLRPLAAEAARLARELGTVRYEWIPRERNKHADELANEAMDAQSGTPRKARTTPAAESAAPESAHSGSAAEAAPTTTTAPTTTAETRSGATAWTGASGEPTRLLLLRHGRTEFSVQWRYSGRGDVQLDGAGTDQAARAARRLAGMAGIAGVVSSPLGRARSTAEAAADKLGLPVEVCDGLTETDFGEWEGLTFTEAAERYPELHGRWLSDASVATPGGESFAQVHQRVRRVRDEIIARYGGSTVLVVSHVTPIKSVLRMALDGGPSLLYRLHLDLASLSIAEFYPDGNASVRLVNDTSHLD